MRNRIGNSEADVPQEVVPGVGVAVDIGSSSRPPREVVFVWCTGTNGTLGVGALTEDQFYDEGAHLVQPSVSCLLVL